MVGASRSAVHALCASVLGIPLSKGTIQRRVERVSEAILPHDRAIGEVARTSLVNDIDETSWLRHGDRPWLWMMVPPEVAYLQRHPHRSKVACAQLMGAWMGVLVRESYRVSQSWAGRRQSCLAPLSRVAQGLAERVEAGRALWGCRVLTERQRRCHRGTELPTVGQWRAWYARCSDRLRLHTAQEDKAGVCARRLQREGASLGCCWTSKAWKRRRPSWSAPTDAESGGAREARERGAKRASAG